VPDRDPSAQGLYTVGYLVSVAYFRWLVHAAFREMMTHGEAIIGIAMYELDQATIAATEAFEAFALAVGDLDAEEAELFDYITRDEAADTPSSSE
jgi:hypothetical protein